MRGMNLPCLELLLLTVMFWSTFVLLRKLLYSCFLVDPRKKSLLSMDLLRTKDWSCMFCMLRLLTLFSSSFRASLPVFSFWLLAICCFSWTSIFFFSFLAASRFLSAVSSYFLKLTVSRPIYLSKFSFSFSSSSTLSSTLSMCSFSCY